MKHKAIIAVLGLALSTGLFPGLGPTSANAQTDVSFQVFYDQLSPYGNWVDYPDYGYVWVPGAGGNFRPYGTNGHWVYSDEGWTWVSGYEWGWAPFHYGNWFYDDSYGWMWTPGYQWAPAWVTWGESGGNYCWAPVRPRIDIGVSFGSYRPPSNYWTFCPREHINSVNVSNYYVRNVHNTTIINNITVINNVNRGGGHAYLRGPEPTNVARYTHTTIRPVAIQASARPGAAHVQNGRLAIYRPAVQNTNSASARPSRVQDLHALKPVPGAHPAAAGTAPGNRPGGTSPGNAVANNNRPDRNNRPGNIPGRTPQPANNPAPARPSPQPVNPAPRAHQPAANPSPAPRPYNTPMTRPVSPEGRPVPHQPDPKTSRPPVQQHAAPQPHPMPQQRPAPQPRPMPPPAPQQRPAVQPHPMPTPPQQHPAPPVNRPPAPAPHPNQGGEPEHH
jgi:hypothetical protein